MLVASRLGLGKASLLGGAAAAKSPKLASAAVLASKLTSAAVFDRTAPLSSSDSSAKAAYGSAVAGEGNPPKSTAGLTPASVLDADTTPAVQLSAAFATECMLLPGIPNGVCCDEVTDAIDSVANAAKSTGAAVGTGKRGCGHCGIAKRSVRVGCRPSCAMPRRPRAW